MTRPSQLKMKTCMLLTELYSATTTTTLSKGCVKIEGERNTVSNNELMNIIRFVLRKKILQAQQILARARTFKFRMTYSIQKFDTSLHKGMNALYNCEVEKLKTLLTKASLPFHCNKNRILPDSPVLYSLDEKHGCSFQRQTTKQKCLNRDSLNL